MNIFDLQATIGLNGEAFMDGISEAQSSFNSFSASVAKKAESLKKALKVISGAAAVATGAIVKMTVDAAYRADDLNTLSKQTGIATDTLQKFQYASDLIDVSMETLTGSLRKLTNNMNQARNGSENIADAFDALGVSIVDTEGNLRDNQTVFKDVINALGEIENSTERDAISMQIFGRSAQELNPLILGGADALEELGQKAENAGLILSQDALDGLNGLSDAIDMTKATVRQFSSLFAENFAGGLAKVMTSVNEFAQDIITAINEGGIAGAFSALGDILKDRLNPYLEGLKTALNFDNLPFIDNFIEIAKDLWGAFKDFQTIKFDAIVTFVREFIGAFKQSGAPESVSSIVGNVLEFLKAFSGKVAEFVEAVAKAVQEFVGAFIQNGGVDAIVNIVDSALKFFGVLTDTIASIILDVADAVVDFIGAFDNEAAGKLIADIVSGISDFVDVVLDVAGDILENIAANVKKLFEAFKESGAAQKITELAGAVAEFFKPFTDALRVIVEKIGEYTENLLNVLTDALTGVIKESPGLIDSIKDALEKLTPIVKAAWDIWKEFTDFLDGIMMPLLDHMGTSIKVSFELVLDTLGLVFDLLGDIADFIVNVLQGDFEGAAQAIQDAWGHIVEFFQEIWDGIVEVFSSAWETFLNIGKNIGTALQNGIRSALGLGPYMSIDEFIDKAESLAESAKAAVKETRDEGISPIWDPKEFADEVKSKLSDNGSSKSLPTTMRTQNITGTANPMRSDTDEIRYSDSAIGQASAAGINSSMLGGGGKTIDINLVLDSDVVASAVYDPLQDVAFQRGGR